MQCPNCGQPIEPGDAFCPHCGANLAAVGSQGASPAQAPVPPQSSGPYPAPPAQPAGWPPQPPPLPSNQPPTPKRSSTGVIVAVIVGLLLACSLVGVFGLIAFRAVIPALKHDVGSATAGSSVEVLPTPPSSTAATATASAPATASTESASDAVQNTQPAPATVSTALHTPAPGSAERKAILDVLRAPIRQRLRQMVIFKVNHIAVEDNWAFVFAQPLRPSGRPIDYSRTRYAKAVRDGFFGDDCSGLMHYENGTWTLIVWDIGATDVVWEPWGKQYGAPAAIFKIN